MVMMIFSWSFISCTELLGFDLQQRGSLCRFYGLTRLLMGLEDDDDDVVVD